MTFADRLVAAWYAPRLTALTLPLVPFAPLFGLAVAVRRGLFRLGLLRTNRLPVPVVVVGNITVGGAGKTPLVRALVLALAARGWRPGVVSRGHGGTNVRPRAVVAGDDARVVGDEPLLLAATSAPVWIGHRRGDVAEALLRAHPECDVIVSDDGLQHYALARSVEIAVIDASRDLGNGRLLPAGPLREPRRRLDEVDAIVRLVAAWDAPPPLTEDGRVTAMTHEPAGWRNLARPDAVPDPAAWSAGVVHAVAGIGNPQRFFDTVRRLGLTPVCHAYGDHHAFVPADISFPGASAILMTEKDAVKCAAFAGANCWFLAIRTRIDDALVALIEGKLRGSQAA